MIDNQTSDRLMNVRNIGILAHVDAGKTTITEHMLFRSGTIRTVGRVDRGTTQTDSLEVEQKRGISVRAASVGLAWQGTSIRVIDTPGHVDFYAEVERAIRILDGAVLVVSAVEGIQAQTKMIWNALRNMNIPTLIMVNKIDLLGADPEGVYRQMRALLSEHAFTVQSVLEAGTRSPQVLPLESMDTETMAILSRKAEVFPVLFGSGLHGVGIEELLNAVVSYLPPPRGRPGNSLSAIVYKIEYRPRQGRLLHVRVYEGTLRCREELVHIETSVKDKPTRLLTLADGREFRETDRLEAGDLGIIYGLKDWKIGDIIGDPRGVPELQSSRQPLLTVQVYPKQQSELIRLVRALQQLEDEDPLLNVTWMEDIRELHVRFFGNVQLEIISSLLRSRFGLEAQFSEPSVIYKETPAAVGTGSVAYVTHGYALMTLKVEPGEPDSGVTFVSEISGDMIYPKYQKQIRQVLPAVLRRGPRGYEVIDVKVTLIDGDSQKPITQPSDFRIATPLAMEDALRRTGTVLLEPIVEFELIVPDSYSPVVLSELYKYHMAQGTPVSRHGYTTIEGTMTLADSMNFSILLQSKTAGEAMLQTRFIGYQRARLQ